MVILNVRGEETIDNTKGKCCSHSFEYVYTLTDRGDLIFDHRKNDERSNNKISKIHLQYHTVMY